MRLHRIRDGRSACSRPRASRFPRPERCIAAAAALIGLLLLAPLAHGADRVYWSNVGGTAVSFANLDGTGLGGDLNIAGATSGQPQGVALDAARNHAYWTKFNGTTISVTNLVGTGGAHDLNTTGATVSFPRGVAVDPAHNRIYWANFEAAGTISVANLDGTGNGSDLNTAGATIKDPAGVAIDPDHNRIYWANPFVQKISFANLDGTGGGGDLNTTGATVNAPVGVALDPPHNRIYWTSSGANTVSSASLDGSGGGSDLNTTGATLNGPTFPALLRAPAAAGPPVVSGAGGLGAALSCSAGQWEADLPGAFLSRAPQTLSYTWQLGANDIPGAGAASFTPTQPGSYTCRVTAVNAAGSTVQGSTAVQVAGATPTPVAPTVPAALPTLTSLVTFPDTKACVSRRKFSLRLRVPRGSQVVQATVKLSGRRVAVRKGSKLRSTIDLRGLAKGRFTVTVELKLADGRVVKGSRSYRTCGAKS
jgi:hypothetical protein